MATYYYGDEMSSNTGTYAVSSYVYDDFTVTSRSTTTDYTGGYPAVITKTSHGAANLIAIMPSPVFSNTSAIVTANIASFVIRSIGTNTIDVSFIEHIAIVGTKLKFAYPIFDWNNANNWYTSLGYAESPNPNCCYPDTYYYPGTRAGLVPDPSGNNIIIAGFPCRYGSTDGTVGINLPPSSYVVAISFINFPSTWNSENLSVRPAYRLDNKINSNDGRFGRYAGFVRLSGTFNANISNVVITNSTVNGNTNHCVYESGTINGSIANNVLLASNTYGSLTMNSTTIRIVAGNIKSGIYTSNSNVVLTAAQSNISNGYFLGNVVKTSPAASIVGGTYSPSASVTFIRPNTLDSTLYPKDPGFNQNGTFSPIITLVGVPDILGAGLP